MASVVERKTGAGERRLYVVFWATDRTTSGKRKVWELVPGGIKEAKARKSEIEAGLHRNGHLWPLELPVDPESEVPTFVDYAQRWLDERAALRVTPRVLDYYRASVRLYLSPAFGSMRLNEIRRKHVNDLMHCLAAEGKAKNSLRNGVLTPLRKMLNDAVDDEIILANPAVRIEIPDGAPRREARIPEAEELQRIIDKARPDARDVVTVTASLGLRRGEVFALRWADVDLAAGVVSVHATNHRGVITDRTKTKAGRRMVPLFDSARKVLAARKLRLPPERTTPESLIFANAFGGAMDPGNWYRREWLPALEAAGMTKRFHFHELRHYAATRLDEQGMGGKLRTEIIGHADEEITNAVYTHVGRTRVAEAATKFDPLNASYG